MLSAGSRQPESSRVPPSRCRAGTSLFGLLQGASHLLLLSGDPVARLGMGRAAPTHVDDAGSANGASMRRTSAHAAVARLTKG